MGSGPNSCVSSSTSSTNFTNVCGDGIVEFPPEECDDGNQSNFDACTTSCEDTYCGDGYVQLGNGEECDDGNTNDGDGCSAICLLE